jgi:hypothetical protein
MCPGHGEGLWVLVEHEFAAQRIRLVGKEHLNTDTVPLALVETWGGVESNVVIVVE